MNLKPKLQDYLDSTQWKSQDLKVLLEHRNLSTSGYKSTLVDRLVDYLTNISMQEDLESLDPDIEEMTKKELVLECWLYFIQDIGRKNRGELLDALDDCIENGEKSEYLIQFDDADDNNENGAQDEIKFQWPKQSILKNLDFLEVGELCEIYNVVCIEPLKNCLRGFEDKTKEDNIEDNNMTKNSNNDNKNTKTKRKNNSKSTKKSKNKSKNKNDNKNAKKKRKLASRLERYYDDEDDLTNDDDDSDEEMEQDYDNGNDNSRSDDNGEDEDDDEDDGLYISQYNADKMAKYLDSKIDCYKVLVKLRKDCQKLLKLFEKHNYDGNSNDINNGDDLSTIRSDMICGDKEYWVGCPKRMFVNSNFNFNYNFSNSNSNSYYFNRRGVSPDEGIFGIFNSNKIAQEWIKKVENRNMLKNKFSQFNVTKGKLGIDIEIYGCIAGQVWDETNGDNEDEKDNFGIEYNDTNRNKNKNKTSTGGNDDDSDDSDDSDGDDNDDDYDYDLLTNNNQNKKKKKSRNETDKKRNKHNSKSKSKSKSKSEKQEKNSSNDNKNKTVSKRRSKSKVKKSKTELIDDDSESQTESESEENDIEMQDDDIDILTSKDRNNSSTVVLSDDDLDHYDDDNDEDDDQDDDDFGYNGPRRISHTRSRRALN